jgi:hypothetical protein
MNIASFLLGRVPKFVQPAHREKSAKLVLAFPILVRLSNAAQANDVTMAHV